jgi:hypothetical protein
LCFAQAALAIMSSQVALAAAGAGALTSDSTLLAIAALYTYGLAYVVLPAGVAAYFLRRHSARVLLRVLLVVAIPLGIVLPAMLSLFLGAGAGSAFSHPLNPFTTLFDIQFGDASPQALVLLALALALTLLVNAPRMFAGWREVLRARRAREQETLDAPRA